MVPVYPAIWVSKVKAFLGTTTKDSYISFFALPHYPCNLLTDSHFQRPPTRYRKHTFQDSIDNIEVTTARFPTLSLLVFLWCFILIPCYSRGHLRQGVSVRAARRMDLLNDMDLRIKQEQINGTNKPSIGKSSGPKKMRCPS